MTHAEEFHARDLTDALKKALLGEFPEATIAVRGGGINWDCTVSRGQRFCTIHPFDEGGIAKYSIRFEHDDQVQARGRTLSRDDVIGAALEWISGHTTAYLYERYAFVDHKKRTLTNIIQGALRRYPQLADTAAHELKLVYGDYEGWFKSNDRGCHLTFDGTTAFPIALFEWDGCTLLRAHTTNEEQLAELLKCWLCDKAMPSALHARFLSTKVSEIAPYYEMGRPVEGEFIFSWKWIEPFFRETLRKLPGVQHAGDLIAQMRAAGFERTLRAGQSLASLTLSRSRRHGLREDQPNISFVFRGDAGMDVYLNLEDEEKFFFPKAVLSPELHALLKRLEARDID